MSKCFAVTLGLLLVVAILVPAGVLHAVAPGVSLTPAVPAARATVGAEAAPPDLRAFGPTESAVIATIPVGSEPWDIVVNPATHRIYVTNRGSGTVSVIDGATNTVIATIPVGWDPMYMAVNPNTNRVYVSGNGSSSLSVIDGAANTVIATLEYFYSPEGVAVDTERNRIYLVHNGNQLSVIDGASNTVIGALDTGTWNHHVSINAATNRAYVSRDGPSRISVMDLATNSKIAEINYYGTLAVDADTNRIYIENLDAATVEVIDGATNNTIASIAREAGMGIPAVNPSANCLFVPNSDYNSVSIIDTTSNTVVETLRIGLGVAPLAAAVDPEVRLAYVTNRGSNTVSVIQHPICGPAPPTPRPTSSPTATSTATPTSTPTATPTATPATGDIAGAAWYDVDGDGSRDAEEPGLVGVTVQLFRAGLQIGQALTGGDGSYRFAGLQPGAYIVREVQPAWLRWSTTPNEVAVAVTNGGEVVVDFGDWNGRPFWLPLVLRDRH